MAKTKGTNNVVTYLIVTIKDTKTNDLVSQNFLYLHRTTAGAVRMFTDIASDPKTQVAHHLEDYELIEIAQLIVDDGWITVEPTGDTLMTGKQLLAVLSTDSKTQEGVVADITNNLRKQ